MDRVIVIGGGFVGQLVQLACPTAAVLDWRPRAPINHLETRVGPQYLWKPIPGVPSTEFEVTTLVDGMEPTPDRILAYKKKVGKEDDNGDWGLQFQHKMPGWNSALPVPRVEYGCHVILIDPINHELVIRGRRVETYDVLVSTIPMPVLVDLLVVPLELTDRFESNPIYMRTEEFSTPQLNTSGMTLNYISSEASPCYRTTAVGNKVFSESLKPLPSFDKIVPGKIHAHAKSEHVLKGLAEYDIYCYGRFATWRPDELAHQTWEHIERSVWLNP